MENIIGFIKKYKRQLDYVAAFLICILILSVAHFIYLDYISDQEIAEDMNNDAALTARLVSDSVDTYKTIAIQASEAFASVSPFPSERMYHLLREYEGTGRFKRTYIMTVSNHLFIGNGQEIPLSEELKAATEGLTDAVAVSGLDDEANDVITYIAPIYRRQSIMGYFVGEMVFDEYLLNDARQYMNINGIVFIVDDDGRVILEDKGNLQDNNFDGAKNIISYLAGMNVSEKNQEIIKNTFEHNKPGCIDVDTDSGDYRIAYASVEKNENWEVLYILPKNVFISELISQRQAETVIIIFDVIMILVILILFSLKSSLSQKKIENVAYYDKVTGARTKEYFRMEAGRLLVEERKLPYSVVTIDIIGFRYVNELFGHERGDQILRQLATIMMDSMGTKEILARNTADYFEALIVDASTIDSKILITSDKLNEYARSIDVSYPLCIRAGYSRTEKRGAGKNIFDHIDRANAARKTVTEESPKYVVEYSNTIQDNMKEREAIESSKDAALTHEEFKVFLQPKMDLFTGKLAGAEALVRWIRVDGTMVYPDKFIPVFEENGFVEKLDFYMLEKTCQLLRNLIDEGYEVVPISVNQSRVLLMNPSYVEKVKKVIGKYDLPPELVELEITETAFFEDKKRILDVVSKLHAEGYRIDLDDFGSGYSSLNMIKDIVFDILKIDRDFFGDSITGKGKIILKSVVEMATQIDADCICEGVETAEQEELLRSIGCHYAQGYLYSKPIPADKFIAKFMTKQAE